MFLDIRDFNNIWCEGMIVRIVTKLEMPVRFLRISYLVTFYQNRTIYRRSKRT